MEPVVNFVERPLTVLMNIDVSQSMRGEKWRQTCASVQKFISCMGKEDQVNAYVFNEQTRPLESLSFEDIEGNP